MRIVLWFIFLSTIFLIVVAVAVILLPSGRDNSTEFLSWIAPWSVAASSTLIWLKLKARKSKMKA
jgi:hypothetical protein